METKYVRNSLTGMGFDQPISTNIEIGVFQVKDGIKCYASDLAFDNSGFLRDSFSKLYQYEEKNFWFRSRNRIIKYLINKYILSNRLSQVSFLEVGCGTGYVLKGLSEFEKLNLMGGDIYLEGLKYARLRVPDIEFVQFDAGQMPFNNEFDAIGIFDVLEHLENDKEVMMGIHRALKTAGYLFVTVPQHQFLWSRVDEVSCHKRRYSRSELENALNALGFESKYRGSFLFLLFPVMFFSRLLQRMLISKKSSDPLNEFKLSLLANTIFEKIMKVEEWLIKLGISLPFGGSLVFVCTKK